MNVSVKYKGNIIPIAIPTEGIGNTDLLRIACAKLSLDPHKFRFMRNGCAIHDDTKVYPFTELDLTTLATIERPSIVKCLWNLAIESRQADSICMLVGEFYSEIIAILQYYASHGHFVYTINLKNTKTWTSMMELLPTLTRKVLDALKIRLHSSELYPRIDGELYTFNWKLDPHEMVMVSITARDLIQLGYNPASPGLFLAIMNRLRGAIIDGEIDSKSVRDQLQWVQSHFVLP